MGAFYKKTSQLLLRACDVRGRGGGKEREREKEKERERERERDSL